jgi:Carboxypeptidase regulatory-like domain
MRLGQIRRTATLLLFAALACEVQSQTTTSGALAGTVVDQTNAVVSDADVTIRDNAKGTIQSTRTNEEGVYRFLFLAPGNYTLCVAHAGFQERKRTATVLLGPPVSVNVTLAVAKARTDITVSDEAPLIHAENGDVSATMNQTQIQELPNPGNDLTYVVQTAPGVVMNTDIQGGANFSILGMPGFSYLHTMDGMNDNDNGYNLSQVGALILLLGQNQIQEATVVSTGYSGQFGGAAGGNINYITKSGGNRFHGNAQYYWNGTVFDANDWFAKAVRKPRPFSIANQWAASLSGPIRKDKLFVFADTEGLRILVPQPSFVIIPSPEFEMATLANIDLRFGATSATDAFYRRIFNLYNGAPGASSATQGNFNQNDITGCAGSDVLPGGVPCSRHFLSTRGRPSQDTLVSGRIDWNVRSNDRAFLRLQYDGGHSAVFNNPISSVFDVDVNQPWWQSQILETHTFGSSGANQFLVAGSYFAPIYQTKEPSRALAAFPTTLDFQDGFNHLGPGLAYGFGRYVTQYQLSEDFAKIWRAHKFGFGVGFGRTYWSELPGKSIGQLTVQTLRAFYQGGVDPVTGSSDFTTLNQSFTSQGNLPISFLSFSSYADDEWRARRNLTLTFALRAEHYSNPECRSRCFARLAGPFESLSHDPNQPYRQGILINQKKGFAATDNVLWLPRFSFAWQPFGVAHESVLRGGIGLFYDPFPGLVLDAFSGNPPLRNSYTVVGNNLTPGETSSLFKDAAISNSEFLSAFASGETLAQIQMADPNFFPPGISNVATRTHSPQYQRWSLEWQQGLGASTSLNVGYFGYHGIHGLVEDPDTNAFGFGSLPAGTCGNPVPSCAPDPRFSGVTEFNSTAVSNYNGVVASFRHKWTQGLVQANYTYGHAFDESNGVFGFTSQSLTSPQDPNNLRGSYGSADQDVRHSFNANYVWELPLKSAVRGHAWNSIFDGWQVAGTVFARTGLPYTVFDFEESGGLTGNNYFGVLYAVPVGPLRSDLPCGRDAAYTRASHPCQPPQVLADGFTPNPQARFIQSGCATGFNRGNLPGKLPAAAGPCDGPSVSFTQGRNQFRGPGYFNTDFTITKNTKLPGWEGATLAIGFQFFNLFNHPNFGFPDPGLSSPTFGQIGNLEGPPTGILGSGQGANFGPRMIQLKAELKF